ncbi:hypothetical protein BZA05DRAFT_444644 [Tricharina praecox]|uniref:uncharacterized protein n=1 Tax=Tricharina praecox TaxID=43433 RepID=UPI002220BDD3|nr:uncharacterized protein BZA05DRAFT_444644 [Tricharina praecox]KAI5852083.1 hypothetical protein BZA05DRAFT_444644 [Tricharina praecox]
MAPKPPTKTAPSSPPKLSQPAGILKKTQLKKPKANTAAAATTIKAAIIKITTTTSTSTSTVTTATTDKADDTMFDTLIERLQSFGGRAGTVTAHALVPRGRERDRRKQLRWAIQRCMYLERKYEAANQEKSYRFRALKKSRAVKIIAVNIGVGGDEEEQEKQVEKEWEPVHKMPGS